jgi:hypothetical protein
MSTNLPTSSTNSQVLFQSVVGTEINVSADIYDQVLTFFLTKTSSRIAAEQLTQSVLSLTYENSLNPLKILSEFNKAANDSELKTLLIAFFNSLRPSTSKIGFSSNIQTNKWVQRNIVA